MIEKIHQTSCGEIHYWTNDIESSRITISFLPGLTADHRLFDKQVEYIEALNANGEWVTYNAETNTATITSVADFAAAMKSASKDLGAFDQLDEGQGENQLFGTNGESAHFDSTLAEILTEIGSEYADDYAEDLEATDALGHTVQKRINMYSPLYYLMESSDGYGTSTVAQYIS